MTEKPYDSTKDTLDHINRVQELLNAFAYVLIERGRVHDASKLASPEKEIFDKETPTLKALTYGSDEYKAALERLKPALRNHYDENSHHPEHWADGIAGMDLLDVVEMFVDWKASSERNPGGDIRKSIDISAKRFAMSEQLVSIFENTVTRVLPQIDAQNKFEIL